MERKEAAERWRDPGFLASAQRSIEDVFIRKNAEGTDLRGVIVGLDGAPSSVAGQDLQDADLRGVDFAFARLSCSMGASAFTDCRFDQSVLDTCRMASARMVGCSFVSARIESPWMNDAVFRKCSFADATIIGRGTREYGGRRTVFEACSFDRASIQNLELRACRFINCTFDQTKLRKCLIVGTKFDGGHPEESGFATCDLQRVTADGSDLRVA